LTTTDSGSQAIAHATGTDLAFDLDLHDTDGFHSVATNTERLVIPAGMGGYYRVYGSVHWEGNTTGYRILQILDQDDAVLARTTFDAIGTVTMRQYVTCVTSLAYAEYVTLNVYQTSTASLDVQEHDYFSPLFGLDFLGA
jgi:hypothetical protein